MRFLNVAFAIFLAVTASAARAADFTVTLKEHEFSPATLGLPAFKKVTLAVKNMDTTPAELGSTTFPVEPTIVEPGGEAQITISPLQPGPYVLIDVFHNDTECNIIAK